MAGNKLLTEIFKQYVLNIDDEMNAKKRIADLRKRKITGIILIAFGCVGIILPAMPGLLFIGSGLNMLKKGNAAKNIKKPKKPVKGRKTCKKSG